MSLRLDVLTLKLLKNADYPQPKLGQRKLLKMKTLLFHKFTAFNASTVKKKEQTGQEKDARNIFEHEFLDED